jgi:hypothetical protein
MIGWPSAAFAVAGIRAMVSGGLPAVVGTTWGSSRRSRRCSQCGDGEDSGDRKDFRPHAASLNAACQFLASDQSYPGTV